MEINHESGQCCCGCQQPVKKTGRLFLQGHDAKLKSQLINAEATGDHDVTIRWAGGEATQSVMSLAAEFGFTEQVRKGVERRQHRTVHKAAPAGTSSEALRAAVAEMRAEDALAAGQLTQTITAKVGRWTYDGKLVVDGNSVEHFEYTDAKGVAKTTTKFMEVS